MLFDVLLIVIAGGAFIHGYRRGLIRAFFSFVGIFLGILVAFKFGHTLSDYLGKHEFLQSQFLPFIGFLMVIIIVLVVLLIVSRVVEKIAETMLLGFANKLIGGFLEALVVIMLFSTMLWYADGLRLIPPGIKANSKSYSYAVALPHTIFSFIAEAVPFLHSSGKIDLP